MAKASTKVWVVTLGGDGLFPTEDAALAYIRDALGHGAGLSNIALVEGYRREIDAEIELVVHGLRVRPVSRKNEEDSQ